MMRTTMLKTLLLVGTLQNAGLFAAESDSEQTAAVVEKKAVFDDVAKMYQDAASWGKKVAGERAQRLHSWYQWGRQRLSLVWTETAELGTMELERHKDYEAFKARRDGKHEAAKVSVDLLRSNLDIFAGESLAYRFGEGKIFDAGTNQTHDFFEKQAGTPLGETLQDAIHQLLLVEYPEVSGIERHKLFQLASYTIVTRGQGYEFESVEKVRKYVERYGNSCTFPNSKIQMRIKVEKDKIVAINHYYFEVKILNGEGDQVNIGKIVTARRMEIDVINERILPEQVVFVEHFN